jgi:Rieske Fe-S protein
MTDRTDHPGRCDGCALGEALHRRQFVGDVVRAAMIALGADALWARAAAASPPRAIAGSGSRRAKLYPIPDSDGVAIDKTESVIVARFQGKAYAFSLACPHQNTALRWDGKRGRFQCPKHNSRYEPNGTFIEGRATRSMDRFAVTLAGGMLSTDLDTLFRQDKQPAEWLAAFVTIAAAEK